MFEIVQLFKILCLYYNGMHKVCQSILIINLYERPA